MENIKNHLIEVSESVLENLSETGFSEKELESFKAILNVKNEVVEKVLETVSKSQISLRPEQVVAGGFVSNVILEKVTGIDPDPEKESDIDIFTCCDPKTLTQIRIFHERSLFENKVTNVFYPSTFYRLKNKTGISYIPVKSQYVENNVNLTDFIFVLDRDQSQPIPENFTIGPEFIICFFDINQTKCAVTHDGKLYITRDYLEFLTTKQLEVTRYYTPFSSFIRLIYKYLRMKKCLNVKIDLLREVMPVLFYRNLVYFNVSIRNFSDKLETFLSKRSKTYSHLMTNREIRKFVEKWFILKETESGVDFIPKYILPVFTGQPLDFSKSALPINLRHLKNDNFRKLLIDRMYVTEVMSVKTKDERSTDPFIDLFFTVPVDSSDYENKNLHPDRVTIDIFLEKNPMENFKHVLYHDNSNKLKHKIYQFFCASAIKDLLSKDRVSIKDFIDYTEKVDNYTNEIAELILKIDKNQRDESNTILKATCAGLSMQDILDSSIDDIRNMIKKRIEDKGKLKDPVNLKGFCYAEYVKELTSLEDIIKTGNRMKNCLRSRWEDYSNYITRGQSLLFLIKTEESDKISLVQYKRCGSDKLIWYTIEQFYGPSNTLPDRSHIKVATALAHYLTELAQESENLLGLSSSDSSTDESCFVVFDDDDDN